MSRNPTYLTNSQPIVGFTDAEMYDQIDVSDENSRTYVFGVNKAYRIYLPLLVAVKKGDSGHSHRVLDAAGGCHYIPKGWIAIYWTLKANTAIPLSDLSEQMEGANDNCPKPMVDELASSIFQAIDEAEEQVQNEIIIPPPSEAIDEAEEAEVQTEDSLGGYSGPF